MDDHADVDVVLECEVREERNDEDDCLPLLLLVNEFSFLGFTFKLFALLVEFVSRFGTGLPVGELVHLPPATLELSKLGICATNQVLLVTLIQEIFLGVVATVLWSQSERLAHFSVH